MAGRLRVVDVFALAAVELDGLHVGDISHAGGKQRVGFAVNARTAAKVVLLILVELVDVLCQCNALRIVKFGGEQSIPFSLSL